MNLLKSGLGFVAILVVSVAAQVKVIESNQRQLTFSWAMPKVDTASFPDGRGDFLTCISFMESNIALGSDSEPVLPGYSFHVGVPASGEISVSIVPSETKTVRLLNRPQTWTNPGDATPHKSDIVFNERFISQPQYTFMRSLRAAGIVLRPIFYDEASQSLVVVTRATVTIKFPASQWRRGANGGGGDYEDMLRSALLNYEIAQGWRSARRAAKRLSASYPLSLNQKAYSFRIGDGHEGLNESTIYENGILKISGSRIKELFGTARFSRVRLYAARKGTLPDTVSNDDLVPTGLVDVPLMRFDRNGNDTADSDDYLLAYVSGSSDWVTSSWFGEYKFEIDPCDDYRTYWLTLASGSGPEIKKAPAVSSAGAMERSSFTDRIQFKQSLARREENPGNREWIWKNLNASQSSFEYGVRLPGLIREDSGWIRLEDTGRSGGKYSMRFGGNKICTNCTNKKRHPITDWGDLRLRLDFNDSVTTPNARVELSHFVIEYERSLAISDTSPPITILPSFADTETVCRFNLTIEGSDKIYIFRVSADEQEVVLIDTVTRKGGGTFQWVDTAFFGRRYVISTESALKPLTDPKLWGGAQSATSMQVRNLRDGANSTDFLIITHSEFIAAADSLARHKKRLGFSKPVVVDVADIYRWFSGGDKDAVALRNFIRYVYRFWKDGESLDYVLFMGSGHFDPKSLTTTAPDYVPVYITGNNNVESYFVGVVSYPGAKTCKPQMAIGRLPCYTIDQAWDMVGKIVDTEEPRHADYSEWRNRVLFVADDDMQGPKEDDVARSTPHQKSSDLTFDVIDSMWPSVDARKVYLFEYEWDQAYQKPAASRALINEINNGVGYINYFGHGSDVTWTDEYVLTPEMTAAMYNYRQYPIVSAFSCSVGKFDLPKVGCLSGALVLARDVGAIICLSSTREAYASANETLAKLFYRYLFEASKARSVGMALLNAQLNSSGDGYRTYCILGDPSIRSVRVSHNVSLELDDSDDTLAALQRVNVKGSIRKANGSIDESFGGEDTYVAIGLFNAPDSASRKDGGANQKMRYLLPGAPMFMGKTRVSSGRFSQTILVPQNLTFDKPGVKLTAYAWKEHSTLAATGCRQDLIFHGSRSVSTLKDTAGPRITARPAYDDEKLSGDELAFTDRITTQAPASLEIELYDESGIDAAGSGPDEGITFEIEGVYARRNVNNTFQFREGDFRRGIVSVSYDEDALKPGTYTVNVTARDLIGNLAKARMTLVVTKPEELTLDHVLNFPNPVRMGKQTRFYCHTNYTSSVWYGSDVSMTIRIYTLGGRLVRVIRDARNGEVWDCRDQRGNLLSPDVYLYRIMAEDYSRSRTVKSKIMKLVILPPR